MKNEILKIFFINLVLIILFNFTIIFDYLEIGFDYLKYKFSEESVDININLKGYLNEDIVIIGYRTKDLNNSDMFYSSLNYMVNTIVSYLGNYSKIIFLDFKLHDKGNKYLNDINRLSRALKKYDNVFLCYTFLNEPYYNDDESQELDKFILSSSIPESQIVDKLNIEPNYRFVDINSIKLLNSVKDIGCINTSYDLVNIIDEMQLISKYKNKYFESIELKIIRNIYNIPLTNMYVKKNGILLKKTENKYFKIPTDNNIKMRIKFNDIKNSAKILYFNELKSVPPEKFKDKIVLVGTFDKLVNVDIHNTYSGPLFGIQLIAYSLRTIMKNQFYTEFNLWFYLFLILALNFIIYFINKFLKFNSGALLILIYFIFSILIFNLGIYLKTSFVLTSIIFYSILYKKKTSIVGN